MNGWTLWFTGLPASGKTTLARALADEVRGRGEAVVLLDSDELRQVLTPNPTYSDDERDAFYLALAQLAAIVTRNGVNALVAATAPRRAYRDAARRMLPRFAEIYVRCPLSVCRERDPKALYAAAAAGSISHFPGADAPYEEPLAPELTIDSDRTPVPDAVATLLAALPRLTA